MTQGQFKLSGTLAVIGGGRMGEAIITGLIQAGAVEPAGVIVAEPVAARRETLAAAHGVSCFAAGSEAAARADIVLLAVKRLNRPSAGKPDREAEIGRASCRERV